MKVAILYICTGKYSIFWESFYISVEKYFLSDIEKHYFVFTDDLTIIESERIHVKYEKPKGFPLDSLLRFDMFLSIKEKLLDMDFLFFFNSNMKILKSIGKEVLPVDLESGLVALLHPGYFNKKSCQFPYERNFKSSAYIPFEKLADYNYFMGALNGGKTKEYLDLAENCSQNIHKDMETGLTAIYHDESHINHYLHNKRVLILSPAYGYPEGAILPFDTKILILNKMKHGGKYFDKLPEKAYLLRIFLKLKRIYFTLIWKYQ